MSNRFLTGAAVLALLAASAPAAYAQQTTASVRGIVTNDKGQPVAGAKITIIHVPTGISLSSKTDAKGNYNVSGLQAGGPYKIIVEAKTYSNAEVADVSLTIGDQQKLDFSMTPSTEIVVTGKRSSVRSLSNAGSRTRFGRAAIDDTTSVKRDIREVARRDPLVELDPVARGTGPSGGMYIAGSAPRANRITIDGVRSHDDFGLNTGGLSTNRGPVSLDAIDQITVQAVPADVEEGDFTGGGINMTLRSGSNLFHGTLFDYYRSNHWVESQSYNPNSNSFSKTPIYLPNENYGGFFSGPIIKDKLFFAISYEDYTQSDQTQAGPIDMGFATSLIGLGGTAGSGNGGANGRYLTSADVSSILAPWSNYASSSKLNPGSFAQTTPEKDNKSSVKLDWNIMDGEHLSFTYRHAYSNVWKSQPTTSTADYLNTDWYQQPENEDNYGLQLNSKISDNFSTEARIAYRGYQRGQLPPEGQGFGTVSICTDTTDLGSLVNCTAGTVSSKPDLQFGPDQFRQANVLKTSDLAGHIVGTYHLDDHVIKAGYELKNMHIFNEFVSQANGIYYFDSQADFAAGQVDQLQYTNNPSGNALNAAADFNYSMNTLFAQDTFDPFPNTTVNYGLRFDFWDMKDRPAFNQYFAKTYGFSNQKTYDGLNVLQPRFGAKWHNDQFEASGSFGLYSGGLPDVFLSNRFGNTGVLTYNITLQRLANSAGFVETSSGASFANNDPLVGALMNNQTTNSSFDIGSPSAAAQLLTGASYLAKTSSTNSLAPNFKMPSDWKYNFSGRYHAPWGTTFGIDGVYSHSNVSLAFKDLRARLLTINGVQQYTPDGRARYDGLLIASTANVAGLAGYTKLTAQNQSIVAARQALGLDLQYNADGSINTDLANAGAGNDFQAYNPNKSSDSTTLALSAQQSFDGAVLTNADHIDLYAAYTYQKTNQYGSLAEFATTESGLIGDEFSRNDFNAPTSGPANYEIRNSAKLNASYRADIFKNAPTTFTLFADLHDGRPLSFFMQDSASGRSPVFGTTTSNELAFIPQLSTPSAGNAYQFVTNGVTTFIDAPTASAATKAADLAALQNTIAFFKLNPGISTKGERKNPNIERFDLHVSQQLPTFIQGHKLMATLDFYNLGNLMNRSWGLVKEYTGGRAGTPIYRVACGDAAGNVQPSSSTVCASYVIQNVSTTSTIPTVDQYGSSYQVMAGLKYSF